MCWACEGENKFGGNGRGGEGKGRCVRCNYVQDGACLVVWREKGGMKTKGMVKRKKGV